MAGGKVNVRGNVICFWKRLQWVFVSQVAIWAVFCVVPFNVAMPLCNVLYAVYWPGTRLLDCLLPRRMFFLGNIPLGVASVLFAIILYSVVGSLAFGAVLVLRQCFHGPKGPVSPHLR